ncbi:hypothetical protein JJB07_18785 [Tumebacillus sp. ITR2]|uniref:Uncharacterized protein n=1 Tax=Tumebacillus amylolyticus TaxID=2801339 RepID=A0ABS1JEF2_9BACL|nr:hypothetical protein [Tumebacillus amylolyticus]MBL0388656.1 hypothetical protein [Tumebacillus amylolyticus]
MTDKPIPQSQPQPQEPARVKHYPLHLWLSDPNDPLHTMWNLHRIYDPRA